MSARSPPGARGGGRSRILVVDDDPQVRGLIGRMLRAEGFEVAEAGDLSEGRLVLGRQRFELVLCDVSFPEGSGLELVREIVAGDGDEAVVMISALGSAEVAAAARELGAFDYVIKPFSATELMIEVANALRRRELEIAHREQSRALEAAVAARTQELRALVSRLERSERDLHAAYDDVVHRLAQAFELHDPGTARHTERMSRSCYLLAEKLGLDEERCKLIRGASPLHDIGKIGVPSEILSKRGPLTADERRAMERHVLYGQRLLADSRSELVRVAAVIAGTHHERFDGSGYPLGLAGEEIPIEGRIAAVADVFDALTSVRPYRWALTVPEALKVIRSERKRFDPRLIEILFLWADELADHRAVRS